MNGNKHESSLMPYEYQIIVSGQVQGVFFRAKTKDHADRLGIKGTVRNLVDGDVEIRVASTIEDAHQLISAMQEESLPIHIISLHITKVFSEKNHTSFRIIY